MAASDAILGPVLGAALGALGAAIAAVIGAVVMTRLSRARPKTEDIELQDEPGFADRPHEQDRAQVEGVNFVGRCRASTL
ncbi:hypothetical protein NUW58_g1702 [Xylaria curta]|uniref:Uncharacterized protein n=1 Tax=Xylaria curta TaxID=42375 RepID=A0ACC1PIZ6_9PEZI|nr:hypothetical protein NUW58_g1702 [Xylaria curta]